MRTRPQPVANGWVSNNRKRGSRVFAEAQVVATPVPPLTSERPLIAEPISRFHRIWPLAGLAAAMMVNLAWMGFLGYGFFKLVEPVFF
jgi:hypothetical protein